MGNVTSHEIGHTHRQLPRRPVQRGAQPDGPGGGNFPLLYGVGRDGVGGTADDPDVDFEMDTYNPSEGFTGLEDTLNVSAWGLSDR